MEDSALQLLVDRIMAGEKGVISGSNIGRGIQGSANISRLNNMLAKTMHEQGRSADDIIKAQRQVAAENIGANAEARTAATQATSLDLIARNLDKQLPRALELSNKIQRAGSWVPLNELMQKGASSISNTDLRLFQVANLQVAELWARAMNPKGVMRLEDRQLALDLLRTADKQATYKAVLDELHAFVEREREAVAEFKAAHGGTMPEEPLTLPSGGTINHPSHGLTKPTAAPVTSPAATPSSVPSIADQPGWGIRKIEDTAKPQEDFSGVQP
jgi:hypothetical protein